MSLIERVLDIYKDKYICPYCLGRMFSLLATNTTNYERGNSLLLVLTMENHGLYLLGNEQEKEGAIKNLKILGEKANFLPAQKVLDKEGISDLNLSTKFDCYICNNIFNNLEQYANKALESVGNLEFSNFLVGTSLDSNIINKEDQFKAKYNILEAEAFKSHFNREVGKILARKFNLAPKFDGADIVFIFHLEYYKFEIEIKIKPLFIFGRYQKLIRGIPQTRWPCNSCGGLGCEKCNFTGKTYQTSVEELINPFFIKASQANDSSFHGAGREDIDVMMLGEGRPFILELKNSRIRTLDLYLIKEKTNQQNIGKIVIDNLRFTDKAEVIKIKDNAKNTIKVYRALVESQTEISQGRFEELKEKLKKTINNQEIKQRTPIRVAHRRADKVRRKKIYEIEGKYLDSNTFDFIIETQGGTYIKELIHGDEGRTQPSFVDIFATPLKCKKLDVIEIKY